MTPFATRLRTLRLDRGYSQHQAAMRCGFEQKYWTRWEARGVTPTLRVLRRIARGLRLGTQEVGWLVIGGDDHERGRPA